MKALSLWQRFAQWYKRLRHSKGFGVHSPYAFMLVGQLLNCPYRYYAYDDIEGYLLNQPDSRRLRHDARLLIRMVGRMGFSRFGTVGKVHPVLHKAVEIADSRVKHCALTEPVLAEMECERLLVYVCAPADDVAWLKRCAVGQGCCILFRGIKDAAIRCDYEATVEACSHGVVFEDTDMALIVVNDRVPRVKYTTII